MSIRSEEVVSLIRGELDTATLAARHGVTPAEVETWRQLYLDGLRDAAQARTALPTRRFGRRLGLFAALLTLALAGVASAQLVTFTAGSPALAADVNGNFNQLKTWLEAKVGTVGTATVINTTGAISAGTLSSTGTITATGTATSRRMTTGYFTPSYATWNDPADIGAGGAAIVNDNGTYQKLMITGNNSGGGPREVGIWDNLTVFNNLTVVGELRAGSIRQTSCAWVNASPYGLDDNADHTVYCPAGRYMAGWKCRASDRLDGYCQAYCCLP